VDALAAPAETRRYAGPDALGVRLSEQAISAQIWIASAMGGISGGETGLTSPEGDELICVV